MDGSSTPEQSAQLRDSKRRVRNYALSGPITHKRSDRQHAAQPAGRADVHGLLARGKAAAAIASLIPPPGKIFTGRVHGAVRPNC